MSRERNPALRDCKCPVCKAVLDGATGFTASTAPKPDDLSVCTKCEATLIFEGTPDHLSLRLLTAEEMETFGDEVREALTVAHRALLRLKAAP